VHGFIGLVLIPPVVLKLGAMGYRFMRYCGRDIEYLLKGPPLPVMRMLVAPGLVAATVGVLATGLVLMVAALTEE
jgi:hypothetical protein